VKEFQLVDVAVMMLLRTMSLVPATLWMFAY